MRPEYLWIALTALFWGGYPLVARSAGEGGARATLVLMIAGLLPIVLAVISDGAAPWPDKVALTKLSVAGVMMGCGLLAFHALATGSMEASISIPIVDIAMLLVSAFGAILVFSEPLTARKLVGTGILLVGIALLHSSES